MNIGVDIDGVLTNMQDYIFEYGGKYAYERGHSLSNLKKDKYYTASIFNWKKGLDDEFWIKIMETYVREERPRFFAKEVLQELHKNHKIYLITARTSMTEEDIRERKIETLTEEWLKKNEIPYDGLYFPGSDKREMVKKLKIDVMIEDNPENIEQLSEFTDIIVFDSMYNKECKDYIRVNSWHEILYYINKGDDLIRDQDGNLIEK